MLQRNCSHVLRASHTHALKQQACREGASVSSADEPACCYICTGEEKGPHPHLGSLIGSAGASPQRTTAPTPLPCSPHCHVSRHAKQAHGHGCPKNKGPAHEHVPPVKPADGHGCAQRTRASTGEHDRRPARAWRSRRCRWASGQMGRWAGEQVGRWGHACWWHIMLMASLRSQCSLVTLSPSPRCSRTLPPISGYRPSS